ncbi:hypothetical protein KZZ52_36100 [Dactylosporangium sp. AC04546]|uniref:hypothetical protein n=1 Tax=Dactylosporangium sp. AC04546 TaxID=2862460 RepID=UPI001EDCD991|nr:hypothetical protein [Dactylosporangium sp. AC04546]WVK79391.1 hypothetical protein KZZ52_36100 [Dactylosporangium sp. AC04546]
MLIALILNAETASREGGAMTSTDVIFKQCERRICSRLAERKHGNRYFHRFATNLLGRSERVAHFRGVTAAPAARPRGAVPA